MTFAEQSALRAPRRDTVNLSFRNPPFDANRVYAQTVLGSGAWTHSERSRRAADFRGNLKFGGHIDSKVLL